MKSHLPFIFLLFVSACSLSIEEIGIPESHNVEFVACFDTWDDTKTTLDDSERLLWDPNDEIAIYNRYSTEGRVFKIESVSKDSRTASFSGQIQEDDQYYALYPSSFGRSFDADGELVSFALPDEQYFIDGSFANNANPMMSISDSFDLSFRNLCGAFCLPLTGNVKISKIVLSDNDESFPMWGDCSVDPQYRMAIDNAADKKNEISLICENAVKLSPAETNFVFVVPSGAFASGFKVSVYDSKDDKIAEFATSNDKNIIHRSKMRRMPVKTIFSSGYEFDGEVTPEKRYATFGFDDTRETDFNWVVPMFEKYSGHATYNAIPNYSRVTPERINMLRSRGDEIGDHTFDHQQFWQNSPLWNGQDPADPDGDQIPFPSNSQMRDNRGDGRNVFGAMLTTAVNSTLSGQDINISTAWGNLTDEECQRIRNRYSLMKQSSMISLFDSLSNLYLGTNGSSVGSWDDGLGCYTGGIFTGCKTSANHEVWERAAEIMICYFSDHFGLPFIRTWSLPGAPNGSLFFWDTKTKLYYYDEDFTAQANYLARFPSSYLTDADGSPKMRSWTDVLREHGYVNSHDYIWPGRQDGATATVAMSNNYIYNAQLSRKDCLAYGLYGNKNAPFSNLSSYSESLTATEMYNQQKGFYKAIEDIRRVSANGCIATGAADSDDTMSQQIYLRELLNYCKTVGIELVNEAEAYDICFNHPVMDGNLVYNPGFRNTAKEFMPEAEVPTNPDGYTGSCSVIDENGTPALMTAGTTTYLHFGIPVGPVSYSASIKGKGTVKIYEIRNSSPRSGDDKHLLTSIAVDNSGSYQTKTASFTVSDYPATEYEQRFEGLGDKVCGIRIVYSSGLSVKDINLSRVGSKTARTAAKGNRTIDICNGVWDE